MGLRESWHCADPLTNSFILFIVAFIPRRGIIWLIFPADPWVDGCPPTRSFENKSFGRPLTFKICLASGAQDKTPAT